MGIAQPLPPGFVVNRIPAGQCHCHYCKELFITNRKASALWPVCPKCRVYAGATENKPLPRLITNIKSASVRLKRFGKNLQWLDDTLVAQRRACHRCKAPLTLRNLEIEHDTTCCPGTKSCGECVTGIVCKACFRSVKKGDSIR
jgi:hypothetical protein